MANTKTPALSADTIRTWLSYDPETGILLWKMSPARNIHAGKTAGTFKGVRTSIKTGKSTRYMYIKVAGYEMPAARVAWVIHHGRWPEGNVLFDDGDPSNLKLSNLREALFTPVLVDRGMVKKNVMSREAQRHYGLKRYYGLSLEQYTELLNAQDGVCAICGGIETVMTGLEPKPLAVDHCHDSGKIRGLLCSGCNQAIGLMKNDPDTLRSAAVYLATRS